MRHIQRDWVCCLLLAENILLLSTPHGLGFACTGGARAWGAAGDACVRMRSTV